MTRPLFVLALALFATMLGNGVVIPFMPLYAQQFGARGAAIGLLFGSSLWLLSAWTESLHATLGSGFFFVLLAGLLYAPLFVRMNNAAVLDK